LTITHQVKGLARPTVGTVDRFGIGRQKDLERKRNVMTRSGDMTHWRDFRSVSARWFGIT
jgi:hypothetical protein